MKYIFVVSILFLLLHGCGTVANTGEEDFAARLPVDKSVRIRKTGRFRVSAVQFSVKEEIYTDPDVFTSYIDRLCGRIANEYRPDLIVFPEYTGVFLGVSEYGRVFTMDPSLAEALAIIRQLDPDINSLYGLFTENAPAVSEMMDAVFGKAARKYNCYIVGGTYFDTVDSRDGNGELRNRLVVYNRDGERCYTQDKVFLTPFESELLNLSPGPLPDETGVMIDGIPVVFTICRDAFFDEWLEINNNGYIWIDVKANGAAFDNEARDTYRKALPARLSSGDVPYGITVSLTGSFLELYWEGLSTAYKAEEGDVVKIAETESWSRQEILNLTFPYPREDIENTKPGPLHNQDPDLN